MLDWAYLGSIVASLTSAVSVASSSYCWGTSQPYAWLLVGGLTILLFILVAVCLAGCCGLCGFAAGFAAARVGPRALLPAAEAAAAAGDAAAVLARVSTAAARRRLQGYANGLGQ